MFHGALFLAALLTMPCTVRLVVAAAMRKPRRPPHPSTIPGLSQHATLSTMSNAKAGSPTINTEESVVKMPQVRKPRAVSGGNNLFYSFPPPFATPATD